jgi:serine protease AprX
MMSQSATVTAQKFTASTGTGTLEAARGTSHVSDGGTPLTGERAVGGAFSATAWAPASKAKTAWNGGLWMNQRLAGNGWTGTSWASKTWAAGTWPGTTWAGTAWSDSDWSGRYWSGRYWSGRYWSGDGWSGRYWSSSQWSSNGWSI